MEYRAASAATKDRSSSLDSSKRLAGSCTLRKFAHKSSTLLAMVGWRGAIEQLVPFFGFSSGTIGETGMSGCLGKLAPRWSSFYAPSSRLLSYSPGTGRREQKVHEGAAEKKGFALVERSKE